MDNLAFSGDIPGIDVRSDVDRRRPGRLESAHPALLPLLRGSQQCSPDRLELEFGDTDPLGAARGIGVGLLYSILLWGLLVASVWYAFRAIWQAA